MLAMVLRLFGIDLQQEVSRLKAHASELAERASDRVQAQVQETSLTLGLGFIGAVAAVSTIGIALAALFISIDQQQGPLVALAVIGGATAVLAALMFFLTAAQSKRKVPPRVLPQRTSLPPATVQSPPVTRLDLSSLVSPPPHNASLLDLVTHRVTTRAAATSDDAIDAAADFVRTGSRQALLSTLAVTVLLGILMGRKVHQEHRVRGL
jgi:hypothetical protein